MAYLSKLSDLDQSLNELDSEQSIFLKYFLRMMTLRV